MLWQVDVFIFLCIMTGATDPILILKNCNPMRGPFPRLDRVLHFSNVVVLEHDGGPLALLAERKSYQSLVAVPRPAVDRHPSAL